MKYIVFAQEEQESYDIAILIKSSYLTREALHEYYVKPLIQKGIDPARIIAFDLAYFNNKVTAAQAKTYLEELLPVMKSLGIKHLYCADATYFKVLSRQSKADQHFGYMFNVGIKDYEFMQVTIGLNHGSLIYNPNQIDKLDMSVATLADAYTGQYSVLGADIIQYEDYPTSLDAIAWTINRLHEHPVLVCDIETFSLNVNEAGLGTIGFAWSQHEGVAFPVDSVAHSEGKMSDDTYSFRHENQQVRALLRRFFESYKGKLIFHNATYDTKCLIRALWMKDPLDRVGMLHGLHVMHRSLHDTKIIAYLAINSTANYSLGLKDLAHEFAGNWAQDDIKDIRKIPFDELLRYNLIDCLSTFYVYQKHYGTMVADQQEELYFNLMLPTLKVLTQIELIGMPLDTDGVKAARAELTAEESRVLNIIGSSQHVKAAQMRIQVAEMQKANAKLKTKVKPLEDFEHIKFNPNSGQHLVVLLHDVMGLPVLDRTPSKQPATGGDILEKLINHTTDPSQKELLQALIDLSSVAKILSSFLPSFEAATLKADGRAYLHGGFNLGGTISGRLSSSKP